MGNVKSIRNILFVGPLTEKHGQGYVTLQTFNILKQSNFKVSVINTFASNYLFKFLNNIYVLCKIILELLVKGSKFDAIYMTPSRNVLSSLKDFLVLFIVKHRNYFFDKKIKVFAHLHGSDLKEFLNDKNYYLKLLKKLYKKEIHQMIILSKRHSEFALGKDYNNYKIISNPIDFECLPIKDINKNKDFLEISFISVPIQSKGLLDSIVWVQSNISKTPWHFNVIGWSVEDFYKQHENVKKEILDNIVEDTNITFHGPVFGKKKFNILQSSNFFIFLSKYASEAQPISILEAILFKNVVLVSDFKMLRDFSIYNSVLIDDNNISEKDLLNIVNNEEILKDSINLLKNTHSLANYRNMILESFK